MIRFSPTFLRHGLVAVALPVAMLPGATPTMAEDERPDLEIKVAGLTGGSQRNVKITVDNLSNWWSDKTVATVQAVAPSGGAPMVQNVPDLGEKGTRDQSTPSHFEFIYSLPADCDGHRVRASLTAGANYEGVKEGNMANNVHELLICNPKTAQPANPQPQPKPSDCRQVSFGVCLSGNDPKIDTPNIGAIVGDARDLEPWRAPGPRARTLTETTVFQTHQVGVEDAGFLHDCESLIRPPEPRSVGFENLDFDGCNINVVDQVLVGFDLDWLSGIPNKQITRANLMVHELREQGDVSHVTCMGGITLLPSDWQQDLVGMDVYGGNPLFGGSTVGSRLADGADGTRSWDVLNEVKNAAIPGKSILGFVLHAVQEDLEVEETDRCISKLSNLRLLLEYTVGP